MIIDKLLKDEWFNDNATIVEHTAWMDEEATKLLSSEVVEFLVARAVEYEKMSKYKGDDPREHVFKEFTKMIHNKLNDK